MPELSDLRLSKNMKYTALYWAMRFSEREPEIFIKRFQNGVTLEIHADKQETFLNGERYLELNSHESFVALECINRLLSLGFSLSNFTLQENCLSFKDYLIKFIVWDKKFHLQDNENDNIVYYKSRLVSGVLEYQSKFTTTTNGMTTGCSRVLI